MAFKWKNVNCYIPMKISWILMRETVNLTFFHLNAIYQKSGGDNPNLMVKLWSSLYLHYGTPGVFSTFPLFIVNFWHLNVIKYMYSVKYLRRELTTGTKGVFLECQHFICYLFLQRQQKNFNRCLYKDIRCFYKH